MQHLGRTGTKDFHFQLVKFDSPSFPRDHNATTFLGQQKIWHLVHEFHFVRKDQNTLLRTSAYLSKIL